jgi:hypothetical protein
MSSSVTGIAAAHAGDGRLLATRFPVPMFTGRGNLGAVCWQYPLFPERIAAAAHACFYLALQSFGNGFRGSDADY